MRGSTGKEERNARLTSAWAPFLQDDPKTAPYHNQLGPLPAQFESVASVDMASAERLTTNIT